MIRTLKKYEEEKKFIDKNIELYDYTLSERMNSTEVNLYLQDTQYYFTFLYEKLRSLEDIIDYLDYYCTTKVEKAKDNIKQKELIISQLAEQYSSKESISDAVKFNNATLKIIKDRNGSIIPVCDIDDNYAITSSFIITGSNYVKKITRAERKCQNYSNNPISIGINDFYRSIYLLDSPSPIEEHLEIELEDPNDFNYFTCKENNCDVEYLGKNSENKVLLKLTCNNMEKCFDPFNYETYKNLSLNSLNNVVFENKISSSINENQTELADAITEQNNLDYLNALIDFWKDEDNNTVYK